MRKGIIFGIGILIILLALAGTGSARPAYGAVCSGCHSANGSFNGTIFANVHKFDGVSAPTLTASCGHCHNQPPSGSANPYNMSLTLNGSFYNSTHRNTTTLASVNLAAPACGNCHNNNTGNNFSLISGAGTNLSTNTCVYCHPKLFDDWNVSFHSSPINTSKSVVTCVICHNEHKADNVVTINTSCLDSACHRSTRASGIENGTYVKHGYNVTQCKYCHLPKVLTVNTTYDTRSHTFNYSAQLISNATNERHEAVFDTLKNVYKNTPGPMVSCEMCHGTSEIPSVNFKAAYRASKHNNTANASAPYCTDCHLTANTTEAGLINGTNTCKNSGCHLGINHVNATEIGSVDCVSCHFNNSNSLRTHDLTFAVVSNISYTCTICHTATTNRSIIPEINEWGASAHNDKEVSVEDRDYNGFYFNNTSQTVQSQEKSCLKCHSPIDWDPAKESDTTKVALPDDFKGILCTVCHNKDDMVNWINTTGQVYAWYNRDAIRVSSSEYRANYTRMADTIELCGNCHSNDNPRRYKAGPGYNKTTDTTPISPHGFPAKDIFVGSWKESSMLNFECIDCHMYLNTEYRNGTMNDTDKITGHSFAVNKSGLQSQPECSRCHVNGTSVDTIENVIAGINASTHTKWDSTNTTVMNTLTNVNNFTGEKNLSRDKIAEAYWKLRMVSSDGSWGVHDPVGTNTLLDEAVVLANAANASLGQATSNASSTVDLVAGWNLVALNGTPSATAPVSVLLSVHDNVTVVWGYNATAGTWELYDPAMVPTSLNTLTAMVPGKGYWILATQACEWTV